MGLVGEEAWTLDQLIKLIRFIHTHFTPSYTIVVYTIFSLSQVQQALASNKRPSLGKGLGKEGQSRMLFKSPRFPW